MTVPDQTAPKPQSSDPVVSAEQVPPPAVSGDDAPRILDGEGFHVDLDALIAASVGITQTLQDMEKCEIRGISGDPEQYGHQGIHDVFASFCGRWQHGVEVLLEDAESLRDGLDHAVEAYEKGDANAAVVPTALEKIFGND